MLTSYKFWYIKRDDDGFITESTIRFFEGDEIAQDEMNHSTGKTESITRYRRRKKLRKADMPHMADKETKMSEDHETIVYKTDDFGSIKTDDELRAFLNGELNKDASRTAVSVQTETDVNKLKLVEGR